MKDNYKNELLKIMENVSEEMKQIIYLDYFDKLGDDKKYILSLMDDAFQTTEVFCFAIRKAYIVQAGLLLRQLLEQVAISFILVNHPKTLPKFIKHYKLRIEWADLLKGEQIEKIAQTFGVPNNRDALAYLDYGWINDENVKRANEDDMLKFAGFSDILTWRKKYLDKLAHTSFTSLNLSGKERDYKIIDNFIEISVKLFDYLCIAFHKLTGFNFVFNNENKFEIFKELYKKSIE